MKALDYIKQIEELVKKYGNFDMYYADNFGSDKVAKKNGFIKVDSVYKASNDNMFITN